MKLDPKKILIIAAGVLIILMLAILAYRFFIEPAADDISRGPDVVTPDDGGQLPQPGERTDGGQPIPDEGDLPTGTGGEQPDIDEPRPTRPDRDNKITNVSGLNSISATVGSDTGDLQYYDSGNNKFYRITPEGNVTPLSDEEFFNVQDVVWSPQSDKAVIIYPDNTKIIYNFKTDTKVALEKHWHDFSFSPDGQDLAFKSIGYDTQNRWLAKIDSDGSEAVRLERIGMNAHKVTPNWSPNGQVVATFEEGSDLNQKTIYFIGQNGENFKSMEVVGRGFEGKWTPDGSRMLYSTYTAETGLRPTLWLINAQGDDIGTDMTPLDLQTWAHKCTFANDHLVYCAVPRVLPEGAGLMGSLAMESGDDIYSLNIVTRRSTLVDSTNEYNVEKIVVPDNNDFIYLVDSLSKRIYKLEL